MNACKCSNKGILKTFKYCPYCGGAFVVPPKRFKYEGQGLNSAHYAVLTGEQRKPRKGDYYLSGCKGYETAYKARHDLDTSHLICELIAK